MIQFICVATFAFVMALMLAAVFLGPEAKAMTPRFRTKALQKMYEICRRLGTDTSSEFYYSGRPRRGAGHRAAYWNGRSGLRSSYPINTFAHAAWAAGQDDLREHGRVGDSGYFPDVKTEARP